MSLVSVKNGRTGQRALMSDCTPRQAVLQAYSEYGIGDIVTADLETAYGHLVTKSTETEAVLGDWTAAPDTFIP